MSPEPIVEAEFDGMRAFYGRLLRDPVEMELRNKEIEIQSGGLLGRVFQLVERTFGSEIETALEFGGGTGVNLRLLNSRKKLHKRFSYDVILPDKPLPDIEYVSGTWHDLETRVPPTSVDLILAIEVIEHVFDPDSMIKLFKRLLKPDGVLVITTPNLSSAVSRLSLLLGWQPPDTEVSTVAKFGYPGATRGRVVGHVRVFTFNSLVQFLRFHGLTVERAFTVPRTFSPSWGNHAARELRILAQLDRVASRLGQSLASRSVVLARFQRTEYKLPRQAGPNGSPASIGLD